MFLYCIHLAIPPAWFLYFSFLFLWVVPVLLVFWCLCLRTIGIFHLLCDHLSVYSQSTLQICVRFCLSIRSSLLCWAAKLSLGFPMCHLSICWCLLNIVHWYGQTLLTHVLVYYSWSGVFWNSKLINTRSITESEFLLDGWQSLTHIMFCLVSIFSISSPVLFDFGFLHSWLLAFRSLVY